jgi:tRNA dimethylallyltransferase
MTGPKPRQCFTLIAGPTASGKSALAAAQARAGGGIVVNADSMQVYRDLAILTARPTPAEEADLPHRLYGFRPAAEPYSVAAWLHDIAPLIDAGRQGGPPLIIVGGTGLYFKALLEGLSPVPDIPDDIRAHWRAEVAANGSATLHAILRKRDPAMAERLPASDAQRIVRALEVLDATQISLLDWQSVAGRPLMRAEEAERLYLSPPRALLYARCDARLDRMIEMGGLEEARRLAELRTEASLPIMRAVGVRPLLGFLTGLFDWEAALAAAKTETRRYAKRQLTWARRNMISWTWLFP